MTMRLLILLLTLLESSCFHNFALSEGSRGKKYVQEYHRPLMYVENKQQISMLPQNLQSTKPTKRSKILPISVVLSAALIFSSPCSAAANLPIPSPSEIQHSITSLLDNLSNSGTKGMIVYTLSFILWTMTVGVTTPIETAAGMAFPLIQSIPLSAIGKIGGAFLQYSLAKYIFRDWARNKMEDNEWMAKIDKSFQSHPFSVALIWRFSPLPEFVKNIGPSLVPTLKTRYQVMATLVHGLPFTVLWSMMGQEAAAVARGKGASVFLKRMVAAISWIGLFVSPSLFGWWIKGLGDNENAV